MTSKTLKVEIYGDVKTGKTCLAKLIHDAATACGAHAYFVGEEASEQHSREKPVDPNVVLAGTGIAISSRRPSHVDLFTSELDSGRHLHIQVNKSTGVMIIEVIDQSGKTGALSEPVQVNSVPLTEEEDQADGS